MTTTHDEIVELINEISKPRSLVIEDFDLSLTDLGLDSLDTMTLLMEIEEKFSIKFSIEEANELSTVNEFATAVESKQSSPGAET